MKNKWLIVWNIIVTVLLLVAVLSGCTSDTRIGWSVTQIQALSVAVGQLQSQVNQNTQAINGQAVQMATLQSWAESTINQILAQIK